MGRLEEYRRKRKFDRTPEPAGAPEIDEARNGEAATDTSRRATSPTTVGKPAAKGKRKTTAEEKAAPAGKRTRLPKPMPKLRLEPSRHGEHGNTFVVQKHSATRLHYDFRLAIDGTLKSWAVPKGPSQSQADKRLAVQTEDHPLEYGSFEGKIPEGNYGAGTVMVWDRGTFVVEGNPDKPQAGVLDALQQMERGELKFSLNGEKLRGSFVLVKIKRSEKGNEWLLIKHKDAAEDPKWNIDEHDGSALTGRSLTEIAEQAPPKRNPCPTEAREVRGARKGAMPSRLEPMLATLVEQPFSDPNWLFEIKWDGVRAMAWIADGALTLRSRNNIDITARYPELAALPKKFAGREAILDGEIVALDAQGRGDFQRLQERMHVRAPGEKQVRETPVVYFVFDLIYCDGYDLRDAPLLERKHVLQRMLHTTERFRYADHQAVHGKELYELAKENGLEGIVAKRADSRYMSDRSTSWAKLKVSQNLDAVVGGWTEARTEAIPFGSLLLGLYEGKKLKFIGHVGSGFDAKKHAELSNRLKELRLAAPPFESVPETNEKPFWVKPELVARVKFGGWTQEKYLRHPVFLGLREDLKPEECKWESEVAVAAPTVVRATEVVGKVISDEAEIEAELFKGRAETINI
jgi:bifunctional non-homologous end joining protein LigD